MGQIPSISMLNTPQILFWGYCPDIYIKKGIHTNITLYYMRKKPNNDKKIMKYERINGKKRMLITGDPIDIKQLVTFDLVSAWAVKWVMIITSAAITGWIMPHSWLVWLFEHIPGF